MGGRTLAGGGSGSEAGEPRPRLRGAAAAIAEGTGRASPAAHRRHRSVESTIAWPLLPTHRLCTRRLNEAGKGSNSMPVIQNDSAALALG